MFQKLKEYRFFRELFVLIKYGMVGAINTSISALVFFILERVGLTYTLYTLAGYIAGIISSFILNRKFTFKSSRSKTFLLFILVNASLLATVQALQYIMIDILLWKEWVGVVLGMVFYSFAGFLLNRNIVFRHKDDKTDVQKEEIHD